MLSDELRRLSLRTGSEDLIVRPGAGSATFGLPKSQQSADPETHSLLQKSKINYLQKTWLQELGYYPTPVYEIHLSVHPGLQGRGYAAQMIRALSKKLKYPLWIMKSRVINPHVYSVIKKLKEDPAITVAEIEYDDDVQGWIVA